MCCEQCHREITPGTERTVWDGVKRWVRVCALCVPFAASIMFGQTSPPDKDPPVMINVLSPSMYENASPRTVTYSSSEFVPDLRSVSHQHWRLSEADFRLSPADKARLRTRKP
jgi:hypothetical protein